MPNTDIISSIPLIEISTNVGNNASVITTFENYTIESNVTCGSPLGIRGPKGDDGPPGPSGAAIFTYGVSLYDDITTALNDDKVPVVKGYTSQTSEEMLFLYDGKDSFSGEYIFFNFSKDAVTAVKCGSNNAWSADKTAYAKLPSGQGSKGNVLINDGTGNLVWDDVTVKVKTTSEWNAEPLFIPKKGEVIIYSDYKTITSPIAMTIPNIKIGDGLAFCIDLPFVGDDARQSFLEHILDSSIHTTAAEKEFWNNKINVVEEIYEGNLVFNRL